VARRPHFLTPLLRGSGGALARRGGAIVARLVEGAFDSQSRRRGLLGRTSFPEGSAVIIAPSSAVHTFGMKFPIDVVFVSRDGRVLQINASVPPFRIAVAWRAFAAIELPAGTAVRADLHKDDHLEIVFTSSPV
jgi:uncharacterized membrane protein (UPF0127 family)